MIRRYAVINDNVVTSIEDMTEGQYCESIKTNQAIVDIEDSFPVPNIGWVLSGAQLVDPGNYIPTVQERLEFTVTRPAINFGCELKKDIAAKIGAKNLVLNKTQNQIAALVPTLTLAGTLLEGGALHTVRSLITSMKQSFPEYTEEFDYCISRITSYVGG